MTKVTINGRTFEGSVITMNNGVVTVDGVVQDGTLSGVVEVRVVEGILGSLTCDVSVTCGEVRGNVDAGGSVKCGDVGGNVDAGGSVSCGNVGGRVDAGGSIIMGKST